MPSVAHAGTPAPTRSGCGWGAGGQPAGDVGHPGHPARPVDALHQPVRRDRVRPAAGLPVPRPRPGPVGGHGERPARAGDRHPDHRGARHRRGGRALPLPPFAAGPRVVGGAAPWGWSTSAASSPRCRRWPSSGWSSTTSTRVGRPPTPPTGSGWRWPCRSRSGPWGDPDLALPAQGAEAPARPPTRRPPGAARRGFGSARQLGPLPLGRTLRCPAPTSGGEGARRGPGG